MKTDAHHSQTLLNAVPIAIQENDVDGRITYSNAEHHKLLGYSDGELIGMTIFDMIHDPDTAAELRKYLAYLVKEQPQPTPFVTNSRRKDGTPVTTRTEWRYQRNENGKLTGFACVISDISDQEAIQHDLRQERDIASNYLDIARIILLVLDKDANVSMVNQETCRITGYSREQLIGHSWFELCAPGAHQEELIRLFKQMMNGDIPMIDYYESPITTASGEQRLIAWRNAMKYDAEGQICGTISSGEDITERRQFEKNNSRLQENLRRSQQMEAVGRLTAGIAHDFNNLLASILGYADLALETATEQNDAEMTRYLTEVITEGEKARDLIKQMLAFSRADADDKSFIPPLPLIKETIKSLANSLPEEIHLTVDAGEIPDIQMQPAQLHQLILAVLNNAAEAIADKGEGHITVTCETSNIDHLQCSACNKAIKGEYLEITVSDDGPGIPHELLYKIFTPLFTTREGHEGMGLSNAQAIIHDYHGHIVVNPIPNYGTTVRILIPSATQASALKPNQNDSDHESLGYKIMVVDDDESIAQLKGELLTSKGCEVEIHSDSVNALRSFQKQPENYDCVLIKRDMPTLNGIDLSHQLLYKHPGLPVVLFIPGNDDSDPTPLLAQGIARVVKKPINSERLTALICQLVNK